MTIRVIMSVYGSRSPQRRGIPAIVDFEAVFYEVIVTTSAVSSTNLGSIYSSLQAAYYYAGRPSLISFTNQNLTVHVFCRSTADLRLILQSSQQSRSFCQLNTTQLTRYYIRRSYIGDYLNIYNRRAINIYK